MYLKLTYFISFFVFFYLFIGILYALKMIKLQIYSKFSDCKRGDVQIKMMKMNFHASKNTIVKSDTSSNSVKSFQF